MPVPTIQESNGRDDRASSSVAASTAEEEKNIWIAAGEGDLERVRHLVDVEGISTTVADQWTYTPLHAAASYGQVDVLRFLLQHSTAPANAIETTDEDGDTPLFAVEDVRIARILVEEFHANAKHENHAGNTAAAQAEENENDDVAAYLRSVTGEAPMYQRLQDIEQDEATPAMDEAIDRQTDVLMERVQDILRRAEARGARSGEELDDEEEAELRRVVGESVLTQIREGWGTAIAAQNTNDGQTESDTIEEESDADRPGEDDTDQIHLPGR